MIRLWAYGIAAALILGGAYLAWRHYTGLVDTKAELSGQLATSKKETADAQQATLEQSLANVELRTEIERVGKLLASREAKRQELQKQRDSANEQLEALKSNPAVAAWMALPVPESVLRLLRRDPGTAAGTGSGPRDPPGEGAGQPRPSDAGAAPGGLDQRAPSQVGPGDGRGLRPVQR